MGSDPRPAVIGLKSGLPPSVVEESMFFYKPLFLFNKRGQGFLSVTCCIYISSSTRTSKLDKIQSKIVKIII